MQWTVDCGRWTVDGGRWTVDGGHWNMMIHMVSMYCKKN